MIKLIDNIKIHQIKAPLVVPFAVAYGTTSQADITVIELIDQDGRVGIGECAPASDFTQKERQTFKKKLLNYLPSLINCEPEQALAELHKQALDLRQRWPLIYCGIELAIRSLQAKQAEQFGPTALFPEWAPSQTAACRTDLTIPLMPAEQMGSFINLYADYGFKVIKVKLSGVLNNDIDRLVRLNDLLPSETSWFFDGNQGFSCEDACQLISENERLQLRQPLFFEQPFHKDDWESCKILRKKTSVMICLDESVTTVADVEKASKLNAAQMINLKLMKSGLAESEAMIRAASSYGLSMMIGGMVESEITMGASLDIFYASGKIGFADLDTPYFFTKDITDYNPWNQRNAALPQRERLPNKLVTETELLATLPAT